MNRLTKLKKMCGALAALMIAFASAQTSHAGMNLRLWGFTGVGFGVEIPGTAVTDLYEDSQFPDEVEVYDVASSYPLTPGLGLIISATGYFEAPQPFATGDSGLNNYGAVADGLFIAPMDGDYKFYVRSDDASALYITDEPLDLDDLKGEDRPAPAAFELGCCGPFEEGEPASDVYTLTAGSGKYLTMVWKEGGGGDFMQVGISINGSPVEVLPLGHVQRYQFFDEAPASDGLQIAGIGPDGPTDFSFEVLEASPVAVYVEFDKEMPSTDDIPDITWEIDGVVQEGQKGSLLNFIAESDTSDDISITRTIEATVEGFGSASFEIFVQRDETAPVLVGARGSGNPAGIIVSFSESVDEASATDPANYSLDGQEVTIEGIEMLTSSSVLLQVTEYNTDPLTVTVSNITDRAAKPNTIAADSSASVAFTSKLLAYWDFNDDSDQTVTIDTIAGHRGQINGALFTADGDGFSGEAGDKAMDFGADASSQHVFVEDASFLNASGASNQMAVTFWQRNVATGASSSYWMVSPGSNGTARGNQAHVPWSDNNIYFDTDGCCDGATQRINRNANLFEDWADGFFLDWHHYVFMKNGDSKEIYIDGKLFHSGTNTGPFPSDFETMTIGSAQNGGNSLQGIMDDFAVFSQALSADEIAGLAGGGTPADLAAPLSQALALETDLTDTTVLEGTTLSLSVGVTGGEPFTIGYQWFQNGEMIPGANGPTYSINLVSTAVSGSTFMVRAFNLDGSFSPVESSEITVTVDADTEPPMIVSITGSPTNTGLTVVFDENLDQATAEDPDNYSIDGINVTGATLVNPTTVSLTTSQQDSGELYTLSVTGVADIAETPNLSDDSGEFYSFERRKGGLTALFYEDGGGEFTDFFPDNRGTGQYPTNYAPYGTGVNLADIQARRSTNTTYFESPATGDINTPPAANIVDNYAQVIFGWIVPPETGNYRFGLATDDNSELYLSSDDSPNNTILIANEAGWSAVRSYETVGSGSDPFAKQSEAIALEAGQEYYVELIVAEGGGGDNAAVAWTFSADGDPEPVVNGSLPIPAEYLIGFHPVNLSATVSSIVPGDGATFVPNDAAISVSVVDGLNEVVNTESVVVTINGQVIEAEVTKDGGINTISAMPSLARGTAYEVVVTYDYEGGGSGSVSFSFETGGIPPIECPQVSTEGLINYWDFEGSAEDKASSLPGNASTNDDDGTPGAGVSFAADGPAGSYGVFDGSNENSFVEVLDSDDIAISGESLSISAWFRVDTFDKSWQALLSHGESTDYRIARQGDNNNMAFNGGTGEPTGGGDVNDGRWHHVAAIVEHGVAASLYIDGQLAGTVATEGITSTATGRLLIGGNPGSADPRAWNGAIDEVAMWKRVLTPYEIQSLATAGSVAAIAKDAPPPVPLPYFETILADEPIAFYRFEETSGQIAVNAGTLGDAADGLWKTGNGPDDSIETDVSYGDGPLPGDGFIGFAPDNKAALMTGINDLLWIDTQNPLLNGRMAFTLEYWVKPTNRQSFSRTGLVGQNDAVEYGFINNSTIQIWTAGGGALDTTYSFDDDEWHHVATVADGTSIRNYFDGRLVGTGGVNTGDYGSSTFNVHIGGGGVYDATGNHFEGLFDEVAIFDKAITPERVRLHYNAGAVGIYPGVSCDPIGDAGITAVSVVDGNIAIDFNGTLQSAPTVNGPWTDVTDTSPHSEAVADGAKFFRAVQ